MTGYTCMGCGLYVPYGTSHSCGAAPQPTYTYTNPVPQSSPGELRIAAALERIADALEAQALTQTALPSPESSGS